MSHDGTLSSQLNCPWRNIFFLPVAFLWLLYYFLLESTLKAVYLVRVFIDSEPVIWVLSQFNVPRGKAEIEAGLPGNIGI